jgi:hypothetical protein
MQVIILRAIFSSIKFHRSLALENLSHRHQLDVLRSNRKAASPDQPRSSALGSSCATVTGLVLCSLRFGAARTKHGTNRK